MPNIKFLILSQVILLPAFVTLAIFVDHHPILMFDINASTIVQHYQKPWLDQMMLAVSFFGEFPASFISVFAVAGIFYWKKFKRESFFTLACMLSGLVILGIKSLINRPRPTTAFVRVVEVNHFKSFPSGHVLSYVLFFGFLIFLMARLENISTWIRNVVTNVSGFLMISIPFSRIYLGAHWLTDTIGGFILGLACLSLLCFFYLNKKVTA